MNLLRKEKGPLYKTAARNGTAGLAALALIVLILSLVVLLVLGAGLILILTVLLVLVLAILLILVLHLKLTSLPRIVCPGNRMIYMKCFFEKRIPMRLFL